MVFLLLIWALILLFAESTRWISLTLFLFALIWIIVRVRRSQKDRKEEIEKSLNTLSENPTWPIVRRSVFTIKGRRCERCGGTYRLHIHHKKPVSLGGDNSINNLEVLCQYCHEKQHGRDFDDYDNEYDDYDSFKAIINDRLDYGRVSLPRTEKAQIIHHAITTRKNIVFSYKKRDSTVYETRRVLPLELYVRDSRQYLRAYCHLRKDERTFRLSRMKDVKHDA